MALCGLFLFGCGKQETGLRTVTLRVGDIAVKAEVADTPETMSRGLMFRDSLPENAGMLFVFDSPRRASFWMRNTKIPLSIAYLDGDGRVLEIRDMFPYDESTVVSYSEQVAYALEMNQGWFTRHGVKPGAVIKIP